jgi:hypothetical protein
MLCDLEDDLKGELSLLEKVFIENGYPPRLVRKIIRESWSVETRKMILMEMENQQEEKQEGKEFFDVLHAPYIKGFSEKLQSKLKQLNVGYVMKKETSIQT